MAVSLEGAEMPSRLKGSKVGVWRTFQTPLILMRLNYERSSTRSPMKFFAMELPKDLLRANTPTQIRSALIAVRHAAMNYSDQKLNFTQDVGGHLSMHHQNLTQFDYWRIALLRHVFAPKFDAANAIHT